MAYRVNPLPEGTGTFTEDRVTKEYKDKLKPAEPVYETPTVDNTAYNAYANALSQLQQMQQAELNRQREAYERQQAELKAQQLSLKNQRDAQINTAFNNSRENLGVARDDSLGSSYVAYMKGIKNMPQIAAAGGNGGYAQSLLAKQQLNYENNRGAIEQSYLNNLRQLEADKNNALTSSEQSYTEGLMGLQTNAQNYLNNLNALSDDATGYAAQMQSLVKGLGNTTSNAKADKEITGYKVGNETMTPKQYLAYLKQFGYTAEEAYDYMKNNNLLY